MLNLLVRPTICGSITMSWPVSAATTTTTTGPASPRTDSTAAMISMVSLVYCQYWETEEYDCEGMYTKASQREVLATLLGSADLADIYLPGTTLSSSWSVINFYQGGDLYIARGHLAPNADFMNYAWQVRSRVFLVANSISSEPVHWSFVTTLFTTTDCLICPSAVLIKNIIFFMLQRPSKSYAFL